MTKSTRTKKQVAQDKRALKILRKTGLYRGKVDLRKAPSKYQRSAIEKFSKVISGAAKVVTSKVAGLYRKMFPTLGDKVAVPADKGDKIVVDAKGQITRIRKTGAVERKHKFLSREKVATGETKLKLKHRYGLPFRDGATAHSIRWFPNKRELEDFISRYEYQDWEDYVIEEEITFTPKFEHERNVDYDRIDELRRQSPRYKRRYIRKSDTE